MMKNLGELVGVYSTSAILLLSSPFVSQAMAATAAPTGLTATATSSNQINVKWIPSTNSNVIKYRIQYASNSAFTGALSVYLDGRSTSSTTLTGLSGATTYYIKIKAGGKTDAYDSAYSAVVIETTAPSGLTASAVSSSQINVTWNPKSTNSNITGYTVAYALDSSFNDMITKNVSGNATGSCFVTGLSGATPYYFKIKAEGSTDDSSLSASAVVKATTLPLSGAATAPSELTATAVSSSRIDLKWTDNSNNETGYTIAISLTGLKSDAVFSSAGGSGTTTFSHTGLKAATTYYYWVKAEGSSDAMDSAPSVRVNATTLNVDSPSPTPTNQSSLLHVDSQGKIIYTPDAKGNVVPDFSYVGYRNSEIEIPAVAVVKTITPVSGDNRANIQAAINDISSLPLKTDGFRGALLLKAGKHYIEGSLVVKSRGVVIRGEGSGSTGTQLIATLRSKHTLIKFAGTSGPSVSTTSRKILAPYLPIGARRFSVESNHGFQVGDLVMLRHSPNQAWVNMLGMNTLTNNCSSCLNWAPADFVMKYRRKVIAVSGDQITIDAPVVSPIDQQYGVGHLLKYTWTNGIDNVGIENLRLTSEYSGSTDESHGWTGVSLYNVENGWVKNVEVRHFGYSAVSIAPSSSQITVMNSKFIDPISQIEPSRRYSFEVNGQRNLVQGCFTKGGRHDFVTGAQTPGPNVFLRGTATEQNADMGPHHRWATGLLFDNIVGTGAPNGNGSLNAQNRRDSGTGHGWAGAQTMIWNSTVPDIVVQSPPGHINWAIGCKADVTSVGHWYTRAGFTESTGTFVYPQSLFEKQLCNRLGKTCP